MPRVLQAGAFLVGAALAAWLGALVDTFAFPLDATSSRALGSPEFAWPLILMSRLIIAAAGSSVFTVANIVLGTDAPRVDAWVFLRGGLLGAAYSAALVGLLHLAIWVDAAPGLIGFWVSILALPIGAAWLGARNRPQRGAVRGAG